MGKRHPNLLAWQWRGYAANHRNPTNLVLHLIAVPLFIVAAILLLGGLFGLDLLQVVLGVIGIGAGLAIQAKGHALEEQAPEPFSDRRDAVSRLLVEQFVTFPASSSAAPGGGLGANGISDSSSGILHSPSVLARRCRYNRRNPVVDRQHAVNASINRLSLLPGAASCPGRGARAAGRTSDRHPAAVRRRSRTADPVRPRSPAQRDPGSPGSPARPTPAGKACASACCCATWTWRRPRACACWR